MTKMPTTLNIVFAFFLPSMVNSIELTANATTINEIDEPPLRNVGKYDKYISTFSACDAEGFEENVPIHNVQIKMGASKRTSPTIDNELLLLGE